LVTEIQSLTIHPMGQPAIVNTILGEPTIGRSKATIDWLDTANYLQALC